MSPNALNCLDKRRTAIAECRRRFGVYLGTDRRTTKPVIVRERAFEAHTQVVGASGVGKSMFLAHLVTFFAEVPRASIICVDPKGDIVERATKLLAALGHAERLILFDPGTSDPLIGFNPLKASQVKPITQCKAVRRSILAATQTNEDIAAQLGRVLLMALGVARAHDLTLVEAIEVLKPESDARLAILSMEGHPDVRMLTDSLRYFDGLQARRQDELAASTLARLEAFIADPQTRRILTATKGALDFSEVMEQGRIVLCNLAKGRSLDARDTQLFGRLLINDVVTRAFAREEPDPAPVYLVVDEAQDFSDDEIAVVLEQGRSLGLHLVLAHHFLDQFREQDLARVAKAITNITNTKVVFRTNDPDDCMFFARQLFIAKYDPRRVLDARLARVTQSAQRNASIGAGTSTSESQSEGTTRASSTTTSTTETHGTADVESVHEGVSSTEATGVSAGHGVSTGIATSAQDMTSASFALGPEGQVLQGMNQASSIGTSHFDGESSSYARSHVRGRGVSAARGTAHQESESTSHGNAQTESEGTSNSTTRGTNTSQQVSIGSSAGLSVEPLSPDAYFTFVAGVLASLANQHFVLKVGDCSPVFVQAPNVTIPPFTREEYQALLAKIMEQPCYLRLADVELEQAMRFGLLRELALRAQNGASSVEPRDVWQVTPETPREES